MSTKGNPTVQIRLHPDVIKKCEQRAKDLGHIMPDGAGNVAGYIRSLVMRDINSGTEIIDGENAPYSVK